MQVSSIPAKFPILWGADAAAEYIRSIPTNSQIGIQNGAASLHDGFPPATFIPEAAGGVPPFGADFNGIFNQLSGWSQWFSAGGPIFYDATFQTNAGGYPNGAIVQSLVVPGNYWQSTVDNNMTDPDTGGAGWQNPPGFMGTGFWQFRPTAETIPGWVISTGLTIGNAASGATARANADTQFLFSYLWSKFSNTQCPVSGGRGASAAVDFAANKTIGTINMQATGVIGVDVSTGLLTGVPVQSGNATTPASILGENLHALIIAELAAHGHGVNDPTHTHSHNANSQNGGDTSGGGSFTIPAPNAATINAAATGISLQSTGSGTAHNNVQRSMLVNWYIKL